MSAPLLKKDIYYTYEDFLTWDTEERYEIIDGVAYAMATPSAYHQRILINLAVQFEQYLKNKKCQLYVAPFAVVLKTENKNENVVQPDLFVICDKSKLSKNSYNGPPELIIEILSPSTASYDCIIKKQLYLEAKVPEYWIVDPNAHAIYLLSLENDNYDYKLYEKNSVLESNIFNGCTIKLEDIFEDDITEE